MVIFETHTPGLAATMLLKLKMSLILNNPTDVAKAPI
jgi:hypothetical protein